ncbi:MAG: hypothetical protein AAF721_29965 [Myxococcota bacterium]
MKPCGYCNRHVHASDPVCPFCQRRPRSIGAGVFLSFALGLAASGCAGDDGGDDAATANPGPTTTVGGADGGTTIGAPGEGTTVGAPGEGTTVGGPGDDSNDDEGASYYAGPASTETTWSDEGSTTVGSETTTGSSGTTTSGDGDSTTDEGASYYAGPTSDSTTWASNRLRRTPDPDRSA